MSTSGKYISLSRLALSHGNIKHHTSLKKSYGLSDFRTLKNGLVVIFAQKNHLEYISTALMMRYVS